MENTVSSGSSSRVVTPKDEARGSSVSNSSVEKNDRGKLQLVMFRGEAIPLYPDEIDSFFSRDNLAEYNN